MKSYQECEIQTAVPPGGMVNDVHSQLNSTRVGQVISVRSISAISAAVCAAAASGQSVSICGGRHAMGGQQFATDAILLDMTQYNQVLAFDRNAGTITVESGIQWPELVGYLSQAQTGDACPWGIIQKQTGADRLSIGGALSANVHGRGLKFRPIIQDIESFVLIDSRGNARHCSRSENYELFCLAIGGYGLFGVIATVTIKLQRRQCLRRDVNILPVSHLMQAFTQCLADGYLYGDFQFSIDEQSDDFLNKGVFAAYKPEVDNLPSGANKTLSEADWDRLVYLAHTDRAQAFDMYAKHYLFSNGQRYWSDCHQMSTYKDNYHQDLNVQLAAHDCGTEVISELYVPRNWLADFMHEAASYLRANGPKIIYGTVRLIEKDSESYLAWAKQSYACVIFNLHTVYGAEGREHSARAFRHLIDLAINYGGSFYLTYHKFATEKQVLACYPQFRSFLELKRRYDPQELFQSNWYRHYKCVSRRGAPPRGGSMS